MHTTEVTAAIKTMEEAIYWHHLPAASYVNRVYTALEVGAGLATSRRLQDGVATEEIITKIDDLAMGLFPERSFGLSLAVEFGALLALSDTVSEAVATFANHDSSRLLMLDALRDEHGHADDDELRLVAYLCGEQVDED